MVDQGQVQADKAKGSAKGVVGDAQSKMGQVFGSNEQQAKGEARSAKGGAEHDSAEAKGYVQGAVDSVVGTAKSTVGYVTGNKQMENEGSAQQKGGDAGKSMNS